MKVLSSEVREVWEIEKRSDYQVKYIEEECNDI